MFAKLRSGRTLLILGFALLLLGMQQVSLLHSLSHFKPAPQQQELSAPSDGACLECALLATGSAALPSGALVLYASPGAHVVSLPALVAPTLSRFTPNQSRAPPSLS